MTHHIYQFEGMTLNIPVYFDQLTQKWIEDYCEFIERRVYTPTGYPIMFAGEDACPLAEEATPGGCPDCGSCRYYLRAADHCWIGSCRRCPLDKEEIPDSHFPETKKKEGSL